MRDAQAVRRMQRYIEENVSNPITLRQLADVAGYSPCYSAKLFRAMTGKTPFAYIRSLRLSRAAMQLRDGRERVLDVALDFVFDSHEGFTRAFSREFGLSPHAYRAKPVPIPLFLPYPAGEQRPAENEEDIVVEKKRVLPIFTQVIERPARKLLLLRGRKAKDYFQYCDEVGCDVWGVLCSVKEALYEPVGMWMPDSFRRPGTSEYCQGVELPADYAGTAPEGYEIADLPPCAMMVFQGPAYDDADFQKEISDVWDALASFDPTLYGYEWALEDAPRMQLAPMGYRGYIEMRPVRRVSAR